jgi:hypothetical protein
VETSVGVGARKRERERGEGERERDERERRERCVVGANCGPEGRFLCFLCRPNFPGGTTTRLPAVSTALHGKPNEIARNVFNSRPVFFFLLAGLVKDSDAKVTHCFWRKCFRKKPSQIEAPLMLTEKRKKPESGQIWPTVFRPVKSRCCLMALAGKAKLSVHRPISASINLF